MVSSPPSHQAPQTGVTARFLGAKKSPDAKPSDLGKSDLSTSVPPLPVTHEEPLL
jgi:hypothetical protein